MWKVTSRWAEWAVSLVGIRMSVVLHSFLSFSQPTATNPTSRLSFTTNFHYLSSKWLLLHQLQLKQTPTTAVPSTITISKSGRVVSTMSSPVPANMSTPSLLRHPSLGKTVSSAVSALSVSAPLHAVFPAWPLARHIIVFKRTKTLKVTSQWTLLYVFPSIRTLRLKCTNKDFSVSCFGPLPVSAYTGSLLPFNAPVFVRSITSRAAVLLILLLPAAADAVIWFSRIRRLSIARLRALLLEKDTRLTRVWPCLPEILSSSKWMGVSSIIRGVNFKCEIPDASWREWLSITTCNHSQTREAE